MTPMCEVISHLFETALLLFLLGLGLFLVLIAWPFLGQ